MKRKPFESNPFAKNIETKEDFEKAMKEFGQDIDAACNELDKVEKELNEMFSEFRSPINAN